MVNILDPFSQNLGYILRTEFISFSLVNIHLIFSYVQSPGWFVLSCHQAMRKSVSYALLKAMSSKWRGLVYILSEPGFYPLAGYSQRKQMKKEKCKDHGRLMFLMEKNPRTTVQLSPRLKITDSYNNYVKSVCWLNSTTLCYYCLSCSNT